jgi:hypothetical protein
MDSLLQSWWGALLPLVLILVVFSVSWWMDKPPASGEDDEP